jgi:hypothetical protein
MDAHKFAAGHKGIARTAGCGLLLLIACWILLETRFK